MGHVHEANLGDGHPRKPQNVLFRQHYIPIFGTCWESLYGGHHFRAWRQNGSLADSGAWFLGASREENSREHHTISEDGYNRGRNWLVEQAVEGGRWKGHWWKAEVEWKEGLLDPGSEGSLSIPSPMCCTDLIRTGVNHDIAQDGKVAILTVYRQ